MKTALLSLFASVSLLQAAVPSVIVWNPEHSAHTPLFSFSTERLDQVAADLGADGIQVRRATTSEIANGILSATPSPDALILPGGSIPEPMITPCQHFAESGGMLLNLGAINGYEVRIAQDSNGFWNLFPHEKNFAWQTTALYTPFGMEFRWYNDMLNASIRHTPTDLLRTYLPDLPLTDISRPLPSRWFLPKEGTFYPLIRSRMFSGDDFTPQLFIARKDRCAAIFCASDFWTGGPNADPSLWPYGRNLLAALCFLARDWHSGALSLDHAETVQPVTSVITPPPLAFRPLAAGIDPEGIQPLIRWGAFNGSRAEFGPDAAPNSLHSIPLKANSASIPGGLAPGSTLELALPPALTDGSHARLRIRFALAKPDAALHVSLAGIPLWNESILAHNLTQTVNHGHNYKGTPLELTRLIFLPGDLLTDSKGTLQIHNAGSETIHLDAVQIERRNPATERRYELGLHTSTTLAYDSTHALTPERCRTWSSLRCTTRTLWIGPPEDPTRWDRFDRHVERYLALHPRCQFIFEGTPQWAAISPERYETAGDRKQTTPPNNKAFAEIATRIVQKYGDRVHDWELWNEANIRYFWTGSMDEFAALHNTLAPIVRQYDPDARIIVAGMAGVNKNSLDSFAVAMSRAGALKPERADLFGIHCYTPEGMWDVPYGLLEGHLMALGEPIEIYANEQGYNLHDDHLTPEEQGLYLERGLARLFASGVTKVTCFQSDGKNDFGIIDEKGVPRPAYHAFEDFLELAQHDGHRVELSLSSAAPNTPIRGLYATAAQRSDDSLVLVIDPSDTSGESSTVLLRVPLPKVSHWKASTREETSIPLTLKGSNAAPWAELSFTLSKRTVITLHP